MASVGQSSAESSAQVIHLVLCTMGDVINPLYLCTRPFIKASNHCLFVFSIRCYVPASNVCSNPALNWTGLEWDVPAVSNQKLWDTGTVTARYVTWHGTGQVQ